MHVPIERLYEFLMGKINLTEDEQFHLARCKFCIVWFAACVQEQISVGTMRHATDSLRGAASCRHKADHIVWYL